MEKVKTAVVGCGMISNIYIRNLKNMFSIIDLVALCDINLAAAKSKAEQYGISRVMTLEEVEASDEIELVVNLTAPAAHYSVIKRMLLAGKHVFTEKMLTENMEQGRELLAIANERKLYLGVAPDTVLGAGVQTMKMVIDSGLIGKVTSCFASINRNQSLNSEIFRFIRNNGGAFPYDVGIYFVAAMLAIMGPAESIMGFGASAMEHPAEMLYLNDADEHWIISGTNAEVGSIRFKSGALGSIHFNGNTINAPQSMLYVFGTEGIVKISTPENFNGQVTLIRAEGTPCEIPHTHGYNGIPVIDDADGIGNTYGHRGIGVAEMAWAIRKNRANRCSKEFGFHAMEVLCGLDVSSETGRQYNMTTEFEFKSLTSGYMSTLFNGTMRADAERSLID